LSLRGGDMTEPMVYIVALYRSDNREPLILIETSDIKEAESILAAADEEWTLSTSEKRPFRMKKPIKSSFLPSLIYEIKISELTAKEFEETQFLSQFAKGKSFGETMNPSNFGR